MSVVVVMTCISVRCRKAVLGIGALWLLYLGILVVINNSAFLWGNVLVCFNNLVVVMVQDVIHEDQ